MREDHGMTVGFPGWRFAGVACFLAIALAATTRGQLDGASLPKDPESDALAKEYAKVIRPLMTTYCHRCHGTKRTEADLDLAMMESLPEVRKHPRAWQKVAEMLDSSQMPPIEAKQPTSAERTALQHWVRSYLTVEARATAGDPGPVVLRRLSNAEYTYTLRDLTGVESLQPAREFPVDGAAGEGFTNTGNALVMSPTLLTKYLDAAKEVANHAVLLPDGIVFSPHTTRRDWTDDALAKIRNFYREFSDPRGSEKVNLQGIVFDTNEGGRLPVEKYLAATLIERQALLTHTKSIDAAARDHGLNAKYLGTLWDTLTSKESSLLLDRLRTRWATAKPGDAAQLTAEVAQWQKALSKFGTVGQIGKVGGSKAWVEPVTPLVTSQELRFKIPPTTVGKPVTLYLVAGSVGGDIEHDVVVWQQPRLVAPGRPDLLLRDVRAVSQDLTERRERMLTKTGNYLNAANEASAGQGKVDLTALAQKHGVEVDGLRAWLDFLGIGTTGVTKIEGYFTNKIVGASNYDFINGWGTSETPLLLANSSDRHVRIPGNMKPHSVAVHPSPTLQAAVGWRSPVSSTVRVQAQVTHAHPECGNGVTWSLELRRGGVRQRLATGVAQGSKEVKIGPFENLAIQAGDLISILIGPRDGNHACDLTCVELNLTSGGADGKTWDLAQEVSGKVLAGNPLPDRFGNPAVWHLYTEPDKSSGPAGPIIPAGSLLAKWQTAQGAAQKQELAESLQRLLISGPPAAQNSPDAALYRQLVSLGGPLFRGMLDRHADLGNAKKTPAAKSSGESELPAWGLDPAQFGKRPNGTPIDPGSLCVRAPSLIEIRLPADLVAGSELVTTGLLDRETGAEGSVQLQLLTAKPAGPASLQAGVPIVASAGSAARKRLERDFDEYRNLFPAALCYTKIVPVDEAVTLTLFYREDDQLVRLMLDDLQKQQLDRLWDELHFISQDALTLVDAYAQLMEYATQDADPKVFEPMRKPINERAAAFRKRLVDTQPRHLDAVVDFAARAYRRPLSEADKNDLRHLYHTLRDQEMPHDQAIRMTLARVLVSANFLYRLEQPGAAATQSPISDWELANRLSYFLWASQPDVELRGVAATGHLHDPKIAVGQAKRMLNDGRVRRLATEFACQWLHISDFDHLDEKSERHFPTFLGLREAMYEESIQFFTYLVQTDRPVAEILDADFTFLNEALAKHYGIPGVSGPAWRRVEGVKQYGRGGILGLATTLAKQSGASRTSPILRGNWISEALLGERLPRPPKDVPRLPEDETATEGLTVRQLVEKHTTDPKCAVCHQRIDAFGFSLEAFDAIGRHRDKDLGDRPIDTRVQTMDGAKFEGLAGLRSYLLTERREAFMRQFSHKLLGYALGRAVQLSDEPLLSEMQTQLKSKECRFSTLIETIVKSRQFREIRGKLFAAEE
jgi:Protein of unknown function (DUF1592)/Protein of unknown function (DUF1588)/Protein of unknown function (DUF1587)/Protein of unknown function (DUF1585)/Protein of unknown function (DUF1595)